ncbi:MAG: discoidin domain-containing protein [Balneolaceae bacterium]|nr:discoidin domain-containing protein [Balneolaceae bacterium]
MRKRISATLCYVYAAICLIFSPPAGDVSAQSAESNSNGILDKQQVLERQTWWDNRDWDWYKRHIPFFEAPEPVFEKIYYYRWELMTKHLVYGSPQTGYTFTEFINRPFWSGSYGGISCPLGHQFYEVRWLKNPRIINDFARYWFETPGAEPRSYSNWYGDSMWGIYEVWRDRDFLERVYPYMIKQYNGFVKEHFDEQHGMFMWDGMHDGMEYNINGRQTDNQFNGGEGFRPTLNSYMYGDLVALSKASDLLGYPAASERYKREADSLKRRVQEELWDPDRHFFFHQFAFDEINGIKAYSLTHETGQHAGSVHGREEIGFVPWQFNLPDPGYEKAWKYLMDEQYFYAPFGPTTSEQNDPLFLVSDDCCWWSGNSWPYATTQTLTAMANLLNNYDQDLVTGNDYVELLRIYTETHHKDGRPYLAEAANPFTGSWEGHDDHYHSEHYLHSGFINNVITGLVGLRPQADDHLVLNPLVPDTWDYFALEDVAYHGRTISVIWDREGTRYHRGRGLMLFVDGEKVASSPKLNRMTVKIRPEEKSLDPGNAPVNLAVNNDRGFYPHISASSSEPEHSPYYANDGNYWYHGSPANRWISWESGSGDEEWIAVDFGVERKVDHLKLYFLDDGRDVVPPADYVVQLWRDQRWQTVTNISRRPAGPTGRRANTVRFPGEVKTSKVRVAMTPSQGQQVGLTELEAWGYEKLPLNQPVEKVRNLAYRSGAPYPINSASYSGPNANLNAIGDMDGLIPYNHSPRWNALNTPNEQDWIEIIFGPRKYVDSVEILFWSDDRDIGAPDNYWLEYWDGDSWEKLQITMRYPREPQGMAINRLVPEEPVFTNKIRLVFVHGDDTVTGISEIMVWEHDTR